MVGPWSPAQAETGPILETDTARLSPRKDDEQRMRLFRFWTDAPVVKELLKLYTAQNRKRARSHVAAGRQQPPWDAPSHQGGAGFVPMDDLGGVGSLESSPETIRRGLRPPKPAPTLRRLPPPQLCPPGERFPPPWPVSPPSAPNAGRRSDEADPFAMSFE